MIEVSEAFKTAMLERSDFRCRAVVTFTDGTTLALGQDDFLIDGNTITEGADADGLPLGEAIGRSITIELVNEDDQLSDFHFAGAEIELHLMFPIDSSDIEDVLMGTFTVLLPETHGSTIKVSANDDMYKTDTDYDTALSFPATLSEIFVDICNRCNLNYASNVFINSDFEVTAKPDGVTYRQVLGMVAMIAGGNARISRSRELEVITYSFASPASQSLSEWFELAADTKDITITGISATASQVINGDIIRNRILSGEEGYVIDLTGNPLIEGKETEALQALDSIFIGKSFRKFSGEHTGYPLAEFMDTVSITDYKGNTYFSIITDIYFTFLSSTFFSNSAVSEMRVNSSYDIKTNIEKLIKNERTERIAQITKTEEGLRADVARLSQRVNMTMTAGEVKLTVAEALGEINSVTTEAGYTFDRNGLRIQKSGEEIENLLDNTGMYVNRDDENILTANNVGVNAINVTVRRYLIVGQNARFEDYEGNRTACYFIGGDG